MDQGDSSRIAGTAFAGMVAHLGRDGGIELAATRPGPPVRIDGYSIGVVTVTPGPGPHLGEMHPDGDEFLYVVDGSIDVIVDDGDEDQLGVESRSTLIAGTALVVPRGVWHRLEATEESRLLHVTPGPNGPFRMRPLSADG